MKKLLLLAGMAALVLPTLAHAGTVTITGTSADPNATVTAQLTAKNALWAGKSPFALTDLGTSPSSSSAYLVSTAPITIAHLGTITFQNGTNNSPQSGLYSGWSSMKVVSAFNPTNLDPSKDKNYLVATPGGSVTINLAAPTSDPFSMLWGTVDDYNDLSMTLTFMDNGQQTGTLKITGADVIAADPSIHAGNSPAFVSLSHFTPAGAVYDSVVMTSTGTSFEFDPAPVPEPSALAILGVALLGLGFVSSRGRRGSAAA